MDYDDEESARKNYALEQEALATSEENLLAQQSNLEYELRVALECVEQHESIIQQAKVALHAVTVEYCIVCDTNEPDAPDAHCRACHEPLHTGVCSITHFVESPGCVRVS